MRHRQTEYVAKGGVPSITRYIIASAHTRDRSRAGAVQADRVRCERGVPSITWYMIASAHTCDRSRAVSHGYAACKCGIPNVNYVWYHITKYEVPGMIRSYIYLNVEFLLDRT